MTTLAKRTKNFSAEEVELGLRALAAFSGDAKKASQVLAEQQGVEMSPQALRSIRSSQKPRYAEIYQEVAPYLRARVAERQEQLVEAYTDTEWEILAKVREEIPNLQGVNATSALRNLTIGKGVAFDKARIARGDPTEIREQKADVTDLLKLLNSPKFRGVVNVNPELIVEATVVEET